MFKKALLAVYVIGYAAHLLITGFMTWREMPFMQWWHYMAWQMIYATWWPISWTVAYFSR